MEASAAVKNCFRTLKLVALTSHYGKSVGNASAAERCTFCLGQADPPWRSLACRHTLYFPCPDSNMTFFVVVWGYLHEKHLLLALRTHVPCQQVERCTLCSLDRACNYMDIRSVCNLRSSFEYTSSNSLKYCTWEWCRTTLAPFQHMVWYFCQHRGSHTSWKQRFMWANTYSINCTPVLYYPPTLRKNCRRLYPASVLQVKQCVSMTQPLRYTYPFHLFTQTFLTFHVVAFYLDVL